MFSHLLLLSNDIKHCVNLCSKPSSSATLDWSLVEKTAIIKKQGTSGLPEVHDNIDGTQSCMCCKATHAAEKVSSWLQSTADCGSGRMSQLFRFFFVFLGLRIFTRIYCIWSETREQNLNNLLSHNGPQFLIKNRFTYPNDLPMTSNSLFFGCFWYIPFFLIWVVLVWSKRGEPNASFQVKGNPTPGAQAKIQT